MENIKNIPNITALSKIMHQFPEVAKANGVKSLVVEKPGGNATFSSYISVFLQPNNTHHVLYVFEH